MTEPLSAFREDRRILRRGLGLHELRGWVELALGSVEFSPQLILSNVSVSDMRSAWVARDGRWMGTVAVDKMTPDASSSSSSSNVTRTVRHSLIVSMESHWPLSLVVPPAAMKAYALAFRRVFQLFNAERSVQEAYVALLKMKAPPHLLSAGLCVSRMSHAMISSLLRHFSQQCMGPTWARLVECALHSDSLDQLLEAHSDHLRGVLSGLLLTVDRDLADSFDVLLDTCDAFAVFASQMAATDDADALRRKQFHAKALQMKGLLEASAQALAEQLELSGDQKWDDLIGGLRAI